MSCPTPDTIMCTDSNSLVNISIHPEGVTVSNSGEFFQAYSGNTIEYEHCRFISTMADKHITNLEIRRETGRLEKVTKLTRQEVIWHY